MKSGSIKKNTIHTGACWLSTLCTHTKKYSTTETQQKIDIKFKYPNSFYSRNGKNKILPSIFIQLTENSGKHFQLQYELADLVSMRTLINRESRKGPEFYSSKDDILPIATAENVMYEYSKAKIEKDIG